MPRPFTTNRFRLARRANAAKRRSFLNARKASIPQVRRIVKSAIAKNTELKRAEFVESGSGIDFTGTFYRLTNIPQGDTDNTRDGDKLSPHSLKLMWKVTVGDATNIMRVVIFQWKQNTVSISPTQAYLFTQVGNALSPISTYNWDTRGNFRILKDFRVVVDAVAKPVKTGRVYLKLDKLEKVAYDAAGTAGNNNIYVYVVSDSGAVTHPTWQMDAVLSFTDS